MSSAKISSCSCLLLWYVIIAPTSGLSCTLQCSRLNAALVSYFDHACPRKPTARLNDAAYSWNVAMLVIYLLHAEFCCWHSFWTLLPCAWPTVWTGTFTKKLTLYVIVWEWIVPASPCSKINSGADRARSAAKFVLFIRCVTVAEVQIYKSLAFSRIYYLSLFLTLSHEYCAPKQGKVFVLRPCFELTSVRGSCANRVVSVIISSD